LLVVDLVADLMHWNIRMALIHMILVHPTQYER